MVCCSERTHTNHVLCSNFDGKNIHRNADIRSGPLRALALSAKAPAQKGTSLLMLRCCNLSTFPRISKTTAYTQTTHTHFSSCFSSSCCHTLGAMLFAAQQRIAQVDKEMIYFASRSLSTGGGTLCSLHYAFTACLCTAELRASVCM